jgi:hypothetical protein
VSGYARSVAVVFVALMLVNFIDQTLERTLVAALAGAPVASDASYLAVRNRPVVLAATMLTHALAAVLTGYILGKLAGTNEVQHAIATAVVATLVYAYAFITPNVMLPPFWVRAAMLIITPPALIAGAYIRGQARVIRAEQGETPT